MNQLLYINKNKNTPVYQQIIDGVILGIEQGKISKKDQLPSINYIANQNKIARETVVKAFKILQEKGIIYAIRGKGFYVATKRINKQHRVFLLLDALTPYKQKLYDSITATFGKKAYIDVYFHHYNPEVFQKLIEEAQGNYTSYIILPFRNKIAAVYLTKLPLEKVLIVDQNPALLNNNFKGVFQDFERDIYSTLSHLKTSIFKYKKLTLVFRNIATQVPLELKAGFEKFCKEFDVNFEVIKSVNNRQPEKGESFLVIDDEDLVYLVEHCTKNNLIIGKDIGLLSYNETSLKKVVAGGISVISTEFELMGKTVAEMILQSKPELLANPCKIINRQSF